MVGDAWRQGAKSTSKAMLASLIAISPSVSFCLEERGRCVKSYNQQWQKLGHGLDTSRVTVAHITHAARDWMGLNCIIGAGAQ